MQRYIRPLWILVWLALTITTGAGVWHWSYRAALDGLAERGRADLSLASDRLTAQLFRYRELAVVLARHPLMEGALDGSAYWRDVRSYVLSMADMTGADSIEVVAPSGAIVVALRGATFRPDPAALPLSRALTGSLGTAHAIGTASDGAPRRVFAFAAPVFDEASRVLGAVMVEIDVSGIEENWPGAAPAVIFSDDTGMVFVSNRSDLVMTNRSTGAGFPPYTEAQTGPHQIWTLNGGPYLPRRALHLARALPVIGMQAELLVDTASAERSALLQAAVAAGFLLVFGGVLLVISENRRALAGENQRLEARVAERTSELSEANTSLRREVAEREEAEAALKQAQAELVQAGKLSALGQMSAGISHELNQPLMAIGSFAENGLAFFDRGNTEAARANLGRISELARRMGRIIQNLRAFARQESGPISDVNLGHVVETALETTALKISEAGVTLNWHPPAHTVLVRGGEVRLGQVVVNLLSNAVDAMAASPEKRIEITLSEAPEQILLSLRDTGPGIKEPERVFDPFYTTKEVGASEGMGLGLSISYGLVQSFGGAIRGENHPEGGAVFTLELRPARAEENA